MVKEVRKRSQVGKASTVNISTNDRQSTKQQPHNNGIKETAVDSSAGVCEVADVAALTERLQRLENDRVNRTNSSGNVFKFVLFFSMGVGLTVMLYPKLTSTFGSERHLLRGSVDNGDLVEGMAGDIKKVAAKSYDDKEGTDAKLKGKHQPNAEESESYGNKRTVDALLEQDRKKNGKQIEEALKDEQEVLGKKLNQKQTTNMRGDLMMDEVDSNADGVDIDSEMISLDDDEEVQDDNGDIEEVEDETFKNIPVKVMTDQDIDETVEEVKLFQFNGLNVLDDKDIEAATEKNMKSKNSGDKKTDIKNDKRRTSDNERGKTTKDEYNQTKDKKNKQTKENIKMKKVDNKADKIKKSKEVGSQKDVPDEIKNFKATYQKDVTPKKTFVDGRRIPPMELLPQKPNNGSTKIWMFEEFLSEAECDGLMRVHNKHVEEQSTHGPILCFDSIATLRQHLRSVGKNTDVTPRDFSHGTTCVNATFSRQLTDWFRGNWSYSTAFYPGESPFATAYENRVNNAMGLAPANGGKFQITSYPLGIGYKAHTDCTENSSDKRDRMATVLVYLDTVEEGGETEFPELGIWVRPRKGRALMWNNMNSKGECEPLSIHSANKVTDGHKFILQRWYYYQSFFSLGKRPPEPHLPVREPGQPRVSCDEYAHGSCRWYDEWNFEHLIEYERRKYTLV